MAIMGRGSDITVAIDSAGDTLIGVLIVTGINRQR